MASILFRGGLAPAIGILGRGEPGGEGVRTGDVGMKVLTGEDGKNREKSKGLEYADASLRAAVVITGGVVKSSETRGPLTTSREGGVTRISPSDTRPGGENSAGTLPKFRQRGTSEEGRPES
jgi:hypothetical protein